MTAETPLLETTNASLGQVVDARRVAELPIPHGDPYALIGLAAGTSFMRSARLDRPFEPTHIVGYAMNGVRSNRSDVTIDGLPSTSTANAGEVTASFVPPQGLVQEFKVQTATFDASLGNTEGGVTNLVLKSGTNKLARRGCTSSRRRSRSVRQRLLRQREQHPARRLPLHAVVGRRRRTGRDPRPLQRRGTRRSSSTATKRCRRRGRATTARRRCRARRCATATSPSCSRSDPQYQIYNPFTRRAIGGGRFQQDPFPGNIIPRELMNPVALKVLEYIGRPRTAGNADGTSNYQRPEMVEATEYGSNTHPHRPRADAERSGCTDA